MRFHIHVNDPTDVHPLVMQHDVLAVSDDLERRPRCTPDTANRDRIATECGIVAERVVGCHRLLAGRCQRLHHRLRTARASVRYRCEQPGAEDVLALRLWRHARRRPASRTVDIQHAPVRELDVVEEAHVGAVPRQGAGDSNRGPGLEQVWRDPVARQLGDAVRFADVFLRLPFSSTAAMWR